MNISLLGSRKGASADLSRKPLLDLMTVFRPFSATDPRDKLYAPLGFATDNFIDEILPDYHLPLLHVYGGLVKFCIEKHQNLNILGYCVFREASTNNLPSWIPDWSVDTARGPLFKIAMSKDRLKVYNASGGMKPIIRFPDAFRTLVVKGFCLDIIHVLGGAQGTNSTFNWMIEW